MPIYEYKCENGHVFDVMQRITEDPLTECVECGAPVRKVLHPVNISFKGSGFYSTDYSKAGAKSDTKDTASNGDAGKKTEAAKKNGEGGKKSEATASKGSGSGSSGGSD